MNDKTTDVHPLAERLNDEMLEALDEELELELDDDRLDAAVEHITERQPKETIDRDTYFRELLRLQRELIRLQDWVVHQKLKLVVLFEGRDAAGKGGGSRWPTWELSARNLCLASPTIGYDFAVCQAIPASNNWLVFAG